MNSTSQNLPDVKPLKTEGVDISPEAVAGDLTVLGAVCDEQRRRCNFATAKHVEDAMALIDALRTALTASEKDAARYRWLRDGEYTKAHYRTLFVDATWLKLYDDFDSAIDAAMEKANG